MAKRALTPLCRGKWWGVWITSGPRLAAWFQTEVQVQSYFIFLLPWRGILWLLKSSITCLKLTAFEKLSWHKNWEVESETTNFMAQINEIGRFCQQMVLLFIRCPNKQMIIVETHILLSSLSYVLLNTLQKAGIRVACSRLKGETHVAPTSG